MSIERAERPIASVHIPRSGGTSLRAFWINLYGSHDVLLYSIKTEKFHYAAEDGVFSRANPAYYFVRDVLATCKMEKLYRLIRTLDQQRRERRGHTEELPSEFKVVHGHFSPQFIQGKFGYVRLTTVVRDPLERALSGYFFLRKLESIDPKGMPPWYTPGMTFKDFAFLDEMINYQSKFLDGHSLDIFDLVGTTNKLESFCHFFDPKGLVAVPKLNTALRKETNLSEDFLLHFRKANERDYELYEVADQRASHMAKVFQMPYFRSKSFAVKI